MTGINTASLPSGQGARPVVKRWVPFVAVATANCINIPMMRQRELIDGVTVMDEAGQQPHGESKVCPIIYVLSW